MHRLAMASRGLSADCYVVAIAPIRDGIGPAGLSDSGAPQDKILLEPLQLSMVRHNSKFPGFFWFGTWVHPRSKCTQRIFKVHKYNIFPSFHAKMGAKYFINKYESKN